MKALSYNERLAILELPSLCYICSRGDMTETNEHIYGMCAVDAEYIKPDKSLTRGHSSKFQGKGS